MLKKNNTTIYTNDYVPYYPPNKSCLDDKLLRNKYEKIMENKEDYLTNVKVINFDIINHQSRQDPLKNNVRYYETIYQENLQRAKKEDRDEFIGEAIRSKREDLHVHNNVLNEHFKLNQELIDFKLKNRILFSSMYGNAQRRKLLKNNITQ